MYILLLITIATWHIDIFLKDVKIKIPPSTTATANLSVKIWILLPDYCDSKSDDKLGFVVTQIPKSNRWLRGYNFRASLNAAETPVSHTPSSALSLRPRVCVCVRVRVFSGCSSRQRQRHYLNSFSRRCRHLPRRPRSGNKHEICRNSSFCACWWVFFFTLSLPTEASTMSAEMRRCSTNAVREREVD